MSNVIIVCGSRDWSDAALLTDTLREVIPPADRLTALIVHGACPTGADHIASRWATSNQVPQDRYPADWEAFGRGAGPRRNREMAARGANLCLAFWDGRSRGTADMLRAAREAGIPVRIVAPRPAQLDPDAS